ncbi:malto-oligosyltrehalose trehalohydrolase, partial [Streptomyces sp. SID14478]|nr:malto-oligosyltrehalose trehalohydrolase [Streptomyces sp. SID14478]
MQFEVWAPQAERVALHCDGDVRALEPDPGRVGWWAGRADAEDGTRYGFALDDGPVLPDPRSRRQ